MSSIEIKAILNQEKMEKLANLIDVKHNDLEDDFKIIRRKEINNYFF